MSPTREINMKQTTINKYISNDLFNKLKTTFQRKKVKKAKLFHVIQFSFFL